MLQLLFLDPFLSSSSMIASLPPLIVPPPPPPVARWAWGRILQLEQRIWHKLNSIDISPVLLTPSFFSTKNNSYCRIKNHCSPGDMVTIWIILMINFLIKLRLEFDCWICETHVLILVFKEDRATRFLPTIFSAKLTHEPKFNHFQFRRAIQNKKDRTNFRKKSDFFWHCLFAGL